MKAIIEKLKLGNKSFISGENRVATFCVNSSTSEQKPQAVVVTCSDSRVPVEHIFDVKIGELFVIRNAGNVVSDSVMASIQYAVEILNVKTVIVMGHTSCGAIASIKKLDKLTDVLKTHIEGLAKEVEGCCCEKEAINVNVNKQAEKIRAKNFDCTVYEAIYYMDRGVVKYH